MKIQRINDYRKELMGIAVIWIFCFHVWEPLFEKTSFVFLKEAEWYIKETGYCGVDIFLLLSGMGLVYAIQKQNLKTFYLRRFLRVYPAFFLWFTLSTLIRSDKISFMEYIGRITFFSNWAENLLVYKWFIAAIFMFYLWFPVYNFLLKKVKHQVVFTLIVTVFEIFGCVWFASYIRDDLFLFLNRIPIFLIGILFGYLCMTQEDEDSDSFRYWQKYRVISVVFGIALVVVSYYIHGIKELGAFGQSVKNIINICMTLIICMICSRIFERTVESKFIQFIRKGLAFLGSCSLEFYLTHELISLKIKSYSLSLPLPVWFTQLLVVFLCFAVSLFAAWVLKQIVETGKSLTKSSKFHIL